jgi:hypothetical protein
MIVDLHESLDTNIDIICAAKVNLADSYWKIGERKDALILSQKVFERSRGLFEAFRCKALTNVEESCGVSSFLKPKTSCTSATRKYFPGFTSLRIFIRR